MNGRMNVGRRKERRQVKRRGGARPKRPEKKGGPVKERGLISFFAICSVAAVFPASGNHLPTALPAVVPKARSEQLVIAIELTLSFLPFLSMCSRTKHMSNLRQGSAMVRKPGLGWSTEVPLWIPLV